MVEHHIESVETLCFDYEDATIQGMLDFATEIRDRRARYCRDRQNILNQQSEALAALRPQPGSTNSRQNLNYSIDPTAPPPPNTPNQQVGRNFNLNARMGTADRMQVAGWAPTPGMPQQNTQQYPPNYGNNPQGGSGQAQQMQMPTPLIRVTAPSPGHQPQGVSPSMPGGTQNLQVPSHNRGSDNSGGRSSESDEKDERGSSTPTKEGDGRVQFPPAADGALTLSDIRHSSGGGGGSNQQSQSSAYPRDTTYSVGGSGRTGPSGTGTGTSGPATGSGTGTGTYGTGTGTYGTGTGTYGTGTGTYGTGSSNISNQTGNSCSMLKCPICQSELRVCLTQLCRGDASYSGQSSTAPITQIRRSNNGTGTVTGTLTVGSTSGGATAGSGSSGSGPSTIYTVNYNTDVSVNGSSGRRSDGAPRPVTAPNIESSYDSRTRSQRPTTTNTSGSTNTHTICEEQYYADGSSNIPSGAGYSTQSHQMSAGSGPYPRDTTGNESGPPSQNMSAGKFDPRFEVHTVLISGDCASNAGSPPDLSFAKQVKEKVSSKTTKKSKDIFSEGDWHIEPPPPPGVRSTFPEKSTCVEPASPLEPGCDSILTMASEAKCKSRNRQNSRDFGRKRMQELEQDFRESTEKMISQISSHFDPDIINYM